MKSFGILCACQPNCPSQPAHSFPRRRQPATHGAQIITTKGQRVINLGLAPTLDCPVVEDMLNLPFRLIVNDLTRWLSPAI